MGNLQATPDRAIAQANASGDCYPSIEYSGTEESSLKVPPNATKLTKEVLVDKIKGILYGTALGDAMGLATEFMSRAEADEHYHRYLGTYIPFEAFKQDMHRSRWQVGDWTDDTDQMILLMDGLFATNGSINATDFALRLKYWTRHGFPELGDLVGLGIGSTVSAVVGHAKFLDDPHAIAKSVCEGSNGKAAANGALMRSSILGIANFHSMLQVIANATNIASVTHYDQRCIASCVCFCTLLALMLQESAEDTPESRAQVIDKAIDYGRTYVADNAPFLKEYNKFTSSRSLGALELDDEPTMGYTYKCLGAALFSLKNATSWLTGITRLVMEAGDADTNCAVAGALLGARFGLSGIQPQLLVDHLRHKQWFDKKVDRLISLMGLD